MSGYSIEWKIDVDADDRLEDGSRVDSPEAAALFAYEAFTRPHSIAHVFSVTSDDGQHIVDLDGGGDLARYTPTVLAVGNPFDGLTLYGPFRDNDAAEDYFDNVHTGGSDTWVAVDLVSPRD